MRSTRAWALLSPILAFACAGDPFAQGNGDANLGKSGSTSDASAGGGASSGAGGKTTAGGAGGGTARGGASSGGAQASGGAGGVSASGGAGGALPSGGTTGTGGGTGGAGGPDAGPNYCGPGGTFPSYTDSKGCTNTQSCALFQHQTSCCGDALMVGINHAYRTRFDDLEKICDSQYPACGCASRGVSAEDGTLVPWNAVGSIVVECVNGTCQSKYGGKTFSCGTLTCTDLGYCSVTISSSSADPIYSCVPLGGCTSCGCLPSSGSCACSAGSVGITVTCKGP